MTSPEARVYIALGSNIQPMDNLKRALRMLAEHSPWLEYSSVYRTAPQGFRDQPDFLNMAARLNTTLTPLGFKQQVLDRIEAELGRQRDPTNRNAPRTIDLDIALWDQAVLEYGTRPWRVPDPDILRFAHVAVPLAELAPDYLHPVAGVTLAEIAARFDAGAFRRFALPMT